MIINKKIKRVIIILIGLTAVVYAGLGVGLNYFSYLNPGDGVFYISLAESLVKTGRLQDIATIPPHEHITHQNGVVYIIAFLKTIFKPYWMIAFALLVSSLWTIAYYNVYLLIVRLFKSHVIAVLFLLIHFLQIETVVYSNSFYNEAIYNPILIAYFAHFMTKYLSLDEKENGIRSIVPGKDQPLQILGLVLFLALGVFFRNQHAALLLAILVYALIFERTLLPLMAAVFLAVAGFSFVYISVIGKSLTAGFLLSHIIATVSSLSACSFIYVLNQFIFYLYPQKIFGPCGHMAIFFGLIGLAVFTYGAIKFIKMAGNFFYFYIFYLAATLVFIITVAPPYYHDNRYVGEGVQFLILLFTFCGLREIVGKLDVKMVRMITGTTVTLLAVSFSYVTYIHFHQIGQHSANKTFTRYSVIKSFQCGHDVGQYLIYAVDYRLVYWYLKEPICTSAPEQCALLKGVSPDAPIVYIGNRDDFKNTYEWASGYGIDECIGDAAENWGVHPVHPKRTANRSDGLSERRRSEIPSIGGHPSR